MFFGLVDKTSNWQHMELFKSVFKVSGRLLFSLLIINWYVNTFIKIYCEFCKTSVNSCFFSLFFEFCKTSMNGCFFKWLLFSFFIEFCQTFVSSCFFRLFFEFHKASVNGCFLSDYFFILFVQFF